MTTTLPALPANLAALMSSAAKKPAASAKNKTPSIHIPELDAIAGTYPDLCAQLKTAQTEKDQAEEIIKARAVPQLCELSQDAGKSLTSLRVNGLLMVRYNSRAALRDTADAPDIVAHAMRHLQDKFFTFFAPSVTTAMKAEDIQAINAYLDSVQAPCPRIEYTLDWTPTQTMHDARTMDASIEKLCRDAAPGISPVCYVNAK